MTEITQPSAVPGFGSETAAVSGVRLHYWIGGKPAWSPVRWPPRGGRRANPVPTAGTI